MKDGSKDKGWGQEGRMDQRVGLMGGPGVKDRSKDRSKDEGGV